MNELKDVKVKTTELLAKLRANFARHKEELAADQKAYRSKLRRVLLDELNKLEAGSAEAVHIPVTPPDDHTDDYERAIGMLEMSVDEVVVLTANQFAAFVQDKWHWKTTTILKRMSYTE